MILFTRAGRVNGRVACRLAVRPERDRNGHDRHPSALSHMGLTMRPAAPTAPAQDTPSVSWAQVVIAAAMLATVGSALGSIVMLGVLYAKATGWPGPLPLWEYMKLRDIGEEVLLSVVMLYGCRSRPAVREALHSERGVLKVAAVFGTVALLVTRLIYRTGLQRPGLFALSLVLYVGFIAYPIAWTFARMAPDAEPAREDAPKRLTKRELFQTILGLFLVVGSMHFMHWVIWSPAAGLINLLALIVIPASAIVLGIGARKAMAGVSKALDEEPPAWLLSLIAVVIGWAAVIHYFFFAHPPHSP